MPKILYPELTEQERAVYLSIRAVQNRSGITVSELLDCFPDMAPSRMGDILHLLCKKGAIEKLERGRYARTVP